MAQGRTEGVVEPKTRDGERRSRAETVVAAVSGPVARTRPRRAPMPGPTARVARLSWGMTLLPGGLLILIGAQYALANSVVPAAALHPVNAILILVSSMVAARWAWSAVAVRMKG